MDAELPHWLCASLLEDEEKEKKSEAICARKLNSQYFRYTVYT